MFFNLFFVFFTYQTQQPRTETHHKNTNTNFHQKQHTHNTKLTKTSEAIIYHKNNQTQQNKSQTFLTRNLNGPNVRPLDFLFGHSDSELTILHISLDFLNLRVLRQPEPPREPSAAPLHAVPRVTLLFLLLTPLPTYLENPTVLDLHLHFLLQPRHVGFVNVLTFGVSFQSTLAAANNNVSEGKLE